MPSFEVALPGDAGRRVTAIAYPAAASFGAKKGTLVLAHGAGAPQTHPFLVNMARGLAERGVDTTTFNFPYTEDKRRVPDGAPVLEACFRAVVGAVRLRGAGEAKLVLGGKSMGGRIASHLGAARDPGLGGLVFLGYPLHPPGKAKQLRVKHLPEIQVPMLFVQGTRDSLGTPDELRPILSTLPARTEIWVVDQGDHSFRVPKKSGLSEAEVLGAVMDRVAAFVHQFAP
jgi:uncharacterized protein